MSRLQPGLMCRSGVTCAVLQCPEMLRLMGLGAISVAEVANAYQWRLNSKGVSSIGIPLGSANTEACQQAEQPQALSMAV